MECVGDGISDQVDENCHLERQFTQGPPAATARLARHRATGRRLSAGNEARGSASRRRKSRPPVITFPSPDRRPTTALPCWLAKRRPTSSSATRFTLIPRSACWRPRRRHLRRLRLRAQWPGSRQRQVRLQARLAGWPRHWLASELPPIRSWSWPATSISRRRTATSTTRLAWAGQILCSEPERAAFQRLLGLGLKDSFRLFEQPRRASHGGTTECSASRKTAACGSTTSCSPRRSPSAARRPGSAAKLRKLERPSDHAPVTAELAD
jgi:hypothetical protein